MKTCKGCKELKPIEEFHNRNDGHGDNKFSHCKACENARSRDKYYRTIDKQRLRAKKKHAILKQAVLDYYGHECSCCGQEGDAFLAIDHIHGGGSQHRKTISAGNFYCWLKREGFPSGFQTLCHNCNWAKSHGGCPHKDFKSKQYIPQIPQ